MRDEAFELWDAVRAAYEKNRDVAKVSPSWLATLAMEEIRFPRALHELGYMGCHLQLRQIARGFCGKKFDPVEDKQDDLFPETLQHRYPIRPKHLDDEPQYVLLHLMTDDDVIYNVARMRKTASAMLKHADALEAWGRNRRITA